MTTERASYQHASPSLFCSFQYTLRYTFISACQSLANAQHVYRYTCSRRRGFALQCFHMEWWLIYWNVWYWNPYRYWPNTCMIVGAPLLVVGLKIPLSHNSRSTLYMYCKLPWCQHYTASPSNRIHFTVGFLQVFITIATSETCILHR